MKKIKPFLIIQLRPEDETSDSEYKAILEKGGLREDETVRLRIEKTGIPDLNLDEYSAIIVGGSPFDISKPADEKSDIQKQIEADFERLLTEVIDNDFSFLGACSGNGLLGNHCGATISSKFKEDVGGVDVTVTKEGMKDPLLAGLPSPFRALVGHKEACDDVPPRAVLLGTSELCPVQMFRVGKNVYATQFHPEADPHEFELRINIYKDYGYFPPEDAEKLIAHVHKEVITTPHEILKRFVERYRQTT
jgi:GMP synthase (glutamine-hydrolysing)